MSAIRKSGILVLEQHIYWLKLDFRECKQILMEDKDSAKIYKISFKFY